MMRMKRCVVACAVLTAVGVFGASDPLAGRVEGEGSNPPEGYSPPLISNGDLNMLVEWMGGQTDADYYHLEPTVYWQGRRGPAREAELFGFGKFMPTMSVDGKDAGLPAKWAQTLDVGRAEVVCEGDFAGGIRSRIEVFCALDRNVVALRRRVTNDGSAERQVILDLDYRMTEHDRLTGSWRKGRLMRTYLGTTYGHRVIDFDIRITAADKDTVRRTFVLKPGETATMDWFITFSDSYEANRTAVPLMGWDELFAIHTRGWKAYYDESFVKIPDAKLQRMYDVQQYHLRCNATRWGFPVGIFPHNWQGKYFGFDEMYMHDGLVSAGHFDIARRCPDWRQAVIPLALKRQSYYNEPGKYGARWLWMSLEDGDVETAGIGFWMDHIFAMGTIAKSAWTQYLYSGDRGYLEKTGYQIVQECARFYRNNWILEDGEKAYIGRCTDLERLGPSRDKAFLSTCSAIYALRVAAEACEILKTNLVEAADFRAVAGRLEASLPRRDGRYITCLNEPQESMATLAGFFPFPIFPPDHAPQREAVRHFIAEGRASGNMYPTGSKICSWYAGTMSAASSWMEDRAEPVRWLREAGSAAGLFGEYFEINEPPACVSHPWFATAAGNCLYALDQMLLCDHADAGKGKAHLAFVPIMDSGSITAEQVATWGRTGAIKVKMATTAAGLEVAEARPIVGLRDGTGTQNLSRGWVWVTVDVPEETSASASAGQMLDHYLLKIVVEPSAD